MSPTYPINAVNREIQFTTKRPNLNSVPKALTIAPGKGLRGGGKVADLVKSINASKGEAALPRPSFRDSQTGSWQRQQRAPSKGEQETCIAPISRWKYTVGLSTSHEVGDRVDSSPNLQDRNVRRTALQQAYRGEQFPEKRRRPFDGAGRTLVQNRQLIELPKQRGKLPATVCESRNSNNESILCSSEYRDISQYTQNTPSESAAQNNCEHRLNPFKRRDSHGSEICISTPTSLDSMSHQAFKSVRSMSPQPRIRDPSSQTPYDDTIEAYIMRKLAERWSPVSSFTSNSRPAPKQSAFSLPLPLQSHLGPRSTTAQTSPINPHLKTHVDVSFALDTLQTINKILSEHTTTLKAVIADSEELLHRNEHHCHLDFCHTYESNSESKSKSLKELTHTSQIPVSHAYSNISMDTLSPQDSVSQTGVLLNYGRPPHGTSYTPRTPRTPSLDYTSRVVSAKTESILPPQEQPVNNAVQEMQTNISTNDDEAVALKTVQTQSPSHRPSSTHNSHSASIKAHENPQSPSNLRLQREHDAARVAMRRRASFPSMPDTRNMTQRLRLSRSMPLERISIQKSSRTRVLSLPAVNCSITQPRGQLFRAAESIYPFVMQTPVDRASFPLLRSSNGNEYVIPKRTSSLLKQTFDNTQARDKPHDNITNLEKVKSSKPEMVALHELQSSPSIEPEAGLHTGGVEGDEEQHQAMSQQEPSEELSRLATSRLSKSVKGSTGHLKSSRAAPVEMLMTYGPKSLDSTMRGLWSMDGREEDQKILF